MKTLIIIAAIRAPLFNNMILLVLIINPSMTGKVYECGGVMWSSDKTDGRNNM